MRNVAILVILSLMGYVGFTFYQAYQEGYEAGRNSPTVVVKETEDGTLVVDENCSECESEIIFPANTERTAPLEDCLDWEAGNPNNVQSHRECAKTAEGG